MDFEEAGRRLKLVAALCVAGYGGWWLLLARSESSARAEIEAERSAAAVRTALLPDGREIPVPERIAAADDVVFSDPGAAVERLRAVLAAPKNPDEKVLAETRLPGALLGAHRAAGEARDWGRHEALRAELLSLGRDPTRLRILSDQRSAWLARALDAGDAASAARLAAAIISDGDEELDARQALRRWREGRLGAWRTARAAGDRAGEDAALAELASWEPLVSEVPRDLAAGIPAAEALSRGKADAAAGAHGRAILLLRAADEGRGRQAAQPPLDDAILGLARAPESARPRGEKPPLATEMLERVSGARRAEALALAAAVLEAWADARLPADPAACVGLYGRAKERLAEAARLSGKPVPAGDLARLADKESEARFGATLSQLESNPERAYAELRPLLREGAVTPRRERAVSALRASWRKARDAKAFNRFVDVSAYLAAELGAPPFSDPFRAEFKAGLIALADSAKAEALNKRIFALSLLADSFREDPEAREARREAAARGAEFVRATSNRGSAPRTLGASGLSGRSVALIENGTPHHILMLYEGPETFFVRVNPYRRGAAVLKDGKYLAGVATISDAVMPYAFDAQLASVRVRQTFVIVQSGPRGERVDSGAPPYGDWTLLRAPDGEKPAVDPETGAVR